MRWREKRNDQPQDSERKSRENLKMTDLSIGMRFPELAITSSPSLILEPKHSRSKIPTPEQQNQLKLDHHRELDCTPVIEC